MHKKEAEASSLRLLVTLSGAKSLAYYAEMLRGVYTE